MSELPEEVTALRVRLAELDDVLVGSDRAAQAERRAAIVVAARDRHFHNPDLAARLLADAEGMPDAIVAELAEAEPYLVQPTMNEIIRRAAGRNR